MATTRIGQKKQVLMCAHGDSCGMMYWMAEALNRHSDKYVALHIIEKQHPFEFPHGTFHRDLSPQKVQAIFHSADVVQIGHTNYHGDVRGIPIPYGKKPMAQYHTGFHYRQDPGMGDSKDKSRHIGLSFATPDLCRFNKNLVSLPYPIDSERTINPDRHGYYVKEKIIAHSPSDSTMKGTAIIEPVLREVADKFGLEVVSTKDIPWVESLKLKAAAQVYVDHMYEPYNSFGISSVEAALQGTIPFAMGNNFGFSDHPFINVNSAEELEKELNMYLAYSEKRRIKESECQTWARENFNLRSTARILEENYDRLLKEAGSNNTDTQ